MAERRTYVEEVLAVLQYEFRPEQRATSERKLKRRLREKKLGPYDQAVIDAVRAFKYDVQAEIGYPVDSCFHTGSKGRFAAMDDWDVDGLRKHFRSRHPDVPGDEIDWFVPWAIYLYYLR